MRILFITPFYYPELKFGGPPQKIHSIARGLAARGHEVRVVTFDHGNRSASEEKEVDGINVQYIPWRGTGLRQLPTDFRQLRRQVSHAQITHCYGLYNLLCPMAALISRRAHVSFVLEPLGMFPPRAKNQSAKRVYNFVVTKWLMRRSAAIVAASANEARELGTIAEVEKIVVRRNGIDVSAFESLPSGDVLRERWKIEPDEKIVLFVGRISPIKNLEDLILAFDRANIPNARLVLVGPLPERTYETTLSSLIERCGLETRVILAGPLYDEEQRAALNLADLFVLPSSYESFGNAAAEAVAADVPVLLTDTCGIAPIIHERAGLAVPLGIDSFATGLRTMIDPEKRRDFVAKTEQVKRELSWDEPIAETERLYREIVRRGNR